jgi:NitT/TauT family transport system substrate-binding protein
MPAFATRVRSRALPLLLPAIALAALTACGGQANADGAQQVTVRIGYLPNITHAAAVVGVQKGFLAKALGPNVQLSTQIFNAGPAEVEAINGDAIDVAFLGPNPAINAFSKSHGKLIRIVAGAASGGAGLVVRSGLDVGDPSTLKGKKLGTPQLGNSQDVALRAWLSAHGLHVSAQGGGDVDIASADNATLFQLFKQGAIDGAWVPEPWLSRMVDEAHGTLAVDEATLWPGGRFPTTELAVTTSFLDAHPDVVRHLLEGHVAALDWMTANPAQAKQVVNDALLQLTQKKLSDQVLGDAWGRLSFTADPLAGALAKSAANAHAAGLLDSVDLHGIIDLRALDDILRAEAEPTVSSGGDGAQ